jgi:hypothetical protein
VTLRGVGVAVRGVGVAVQGAGVAVLTAWPPDGPARAVLFPNWPRGGCYSGLQNPPPDYWHVWKVRRDSNPQHTGFGA